MADELKDQRIPIMMSPSEVKLIDDWAFSHRIRSRGEAIRQLITRGIRFEPFLPMAAIGMAALLEYETNGKIKDKTRKTAGEAAKEFSKAIQNLPEIERSADINEMIALSEEIFAIKPQGS